MSNMLTMVRLLAVPLENDYKHTLYFTGVNAQTEYFTNKTVKSVSECSYQRKDKVIRYPACIDDIITCNYVMYRNNTHSSKWYYAFITKMEYKNDEVTDIYIETDVLQTWLFDYTLKPSFVEREHVIDDSVGANTVPECLEMGEYICDGFFKDERLENYVYLIQVTEDWNGNGDNLATNYGGVWSAGGCYVAETISELMTIIGNYNQSEDTSADAIISVYLIPKAIVSYDSDTNIYEGQESPSKYLIGFEKPVQIGSYEPKNKKLLTFPYRYVLLSNNSGSANILHYEHFSTDSCTFEIEGVPTVGGSIKCVPMNYKGVERMQEEGLMLGKFPTCSWSKDLYTNWLTQNAVNLGVGIASAGLQIVGGLGMIATGAGSVAGAGMVASGGLAIAQTLGQVYQHSLTPISAQGNTNGGDINTCNKMNTFYFYKMSIKEEYARIIDEYFTAYGYKVGRVKVPFANHRDNFWYTKTIDANIDGAIPQTDIQKIKECYNRGVTFWSNPANIGNYHVSNLPK